MNQLSVLFGVVNYEFRMQIRRRALWIAFLLFTLLISGVFRGRAGLFYYILTNPEHTPLLRLVVTWTNEMNTFFPIIVGVLLADRLSRDRRTRVDELFTSMPGSLSIRLVGKYLGCTCATLLPLLAYYNIGIAGILYQTHNIQAIPLAIETFAAIMLPGILFISAFSIACTAILWVPLYQFLFIGYWFWGNLLSPGHGIPTISDTILTPIGSYISAGLFGGDIFQAQDGIYGIHPTALQGVESMFLLLGISVFVMFVLWSYLKWEQARL